MKQMKIGRGEECVKGQNFALQWQKLAVFAKKCEDQDNGTFSCAPIGILSVSLARWFFKKDTGENIK